MRARTLACAAGLRLSVPASSVYELVQDGKPVPLVATGDRDYPLRAELVIAGSVSKVDLVRK